MATGWRWGNFPIPGAHVVVIVIGVILDMLWPLDTGWEGAWAVAVGASLILVAVGLMTWATSAAGEANLASPDDLVTTGPYRMSRHPMYVAWTLLYLGLTSILSSGWLLILSPALAAWIHWESGQEEKRMLEKFGSTYQEYRARVRRYV